MGTRSDRRATVVQNPNRHENKKSLEELPLGVNFEADGDDVNYRISDVCEQATDSTRIIMVSARPVIYTFPTL